MSGKPGISVVIVSWNCSADLEACLDSLGPALSGIDHEVIVVDNASSDGTPGMVSRKFPSVRLVENHSNEGFAAANNRGIALSSGELTLLLNPDTLVPQGAVQELVRFMNSEPSAGAVGPAFSAAAGLPFAVRPWIYRFPGFKDELLLDTIAGELAAWLWGLFRGTKPSGPPGAGAAWETDWASGACLLLRRQAFEEGGRFDEMFFLYMEELELCYRMKRAGWKIFILPSAGVVHTGGRSTAQTDAAAISGIYYESRYKFFAKHWPAPEVFLLRAMKAALLALTLGTTFFLGKREERACRRRKLFAALSAVLGRV